MCNMIMADLTARILVSGRYMLYLLENDRASWKCIDLSYNSERKPRTTLGCNSFETILKDGLLMIAIHCLKDKEIIKRAKSMLKAKDMRLELTTSHASQFRGTNFLNVQTLTHKQLAELYAMNRKRSDRCDNCKTKQHPATRIGADLLIISHMEWESAWLTELKKHHFAVSFAHSKYAKGTR